MKVRGKKLTRRQKEALSAAGWDCTAYLWVRDIPNGMVLLNKDTGKTIVFGTWIRLRECTLAPDEYRFMGVHGFSNA